TAHEALGGHRRPRLPPRGPDARLGGYGSCRTHLGHGHWGRRSNRSWSSRAIGRGASHSAPRRAACWRRSMRGGLATFWNLDRRQRSIFPAGHLPGPRVRDITFSPDLNRFITCSEEGELRWWDMTTLTPVGEPLWHRRGGCTMTALSLDGRTLVTGGQDRRVLRWDVATGRTLEPELLYDSPIEAIALTPDGREIIAGTRAGRLHVWDTDSGRGFDLPPQGTGVTSLAV